MKKILIITLTLAIAISAQSQTKKIAHKKAGFFNSKADLSTLDNFGAIMLTDAEMQQMQEYQLQQELENKKLREEEIKLKKLNALKKKEVVKKPVVAAQPKNTIYLMDSKVLNPEMIQTFGDSVQAKNPQKVLKSSKSSMPILKMKAKKSELPIILFYLSFVLIMLNIYRREVIQSRT